MSLKTLWEQSKDCWLMETILYLEPGKTSQIPLFLRSSKKYFAITACNPLGKVVSNNENIEKNLKLKSDLEQLGYNWYPSYSYSHNWREDGFLVAESDAFETIIQLAKKYNQGAIYQYRVTSQELLRDTIPVLISDVASTIEMNIYVGSQDL